MPLEERERKSKSRRAIAAAHQHARRWSTPRLTPTGIHAYHGSPSAFTKFDPNFIGSGQGAASYGHGFYFAGEPKTAEDYKRQLSEDRDWPVIGKTLTGRDEQIGRLPAWVARASQVSPQRFDEVLADFRNRVVETKKEAETSQSPWQAQGNLPGLQGIVSSLEAMKAGTAKASMPGHTYEVELRSDPDDFLDWDQPLNKQSGKVRERLGKAWLAHPEAHADQTGEQIYKITANDLVRDPNRAGNYSGASDLLNKAGIRGIRYLDAGSRNQAQKEAELKAHDERMRFQSGVLAKMRQAASLQPNIARFGSEQMTADIAKQEALLKDMQAKRDELSTPPTHNYVVFDPSMINILQSYELGGLVRLGYHHFKRPVQ